MPGRKYSQPNSSYRYGFNGKELDTDMVGNCYDYGFRIYNPSLGKFLSVDPLSKEYPWNSPYSFAENDVIRCIDLDGLEKIINTIFSAPKDGKPGIVIMTIQKTYHLVTSGLGAMNKSDFNSQEYSKLASKDNTTIYLKTLATETTQAEEASPADIASGNCYQVAVYYNYDLVANDNVTVNDAMKSLHNDKARNGILLNQLDDEGIKSVKSSFISEGIELKINTETDDYFRFEYIAQSLSNAIIGGAANDARAAGSNESYNGVPYNFIMFAKNYFQIKQPTDLTVAEDILHEGGHNDAEKNRHGTGFYEYNQVGTQSYITGDVKTTKTNLLNLINDATNRKNTTTVQFDNSKLKE